MHGDDEYSIRSLVIAIKQDHPGPGTEYEPHRSPPPPQTRAGQRESFEDAQRASNTSPGVVGKAEGRYRVIHIPLRPRRDDDLRHSGRQLVQRRAFAASGLSKTLLRTLPGTGYRIEDFSDARSVRVGVVKCSRQKRARKRSLLDMGSFSKPRELASVLFVKGDVDPFWRGGHKCKLHDSARFVQSAWALPPDRGE